MLVPPPEMLPLDLAGDPTGDRALCPFELVTSICGSDTELAMMEEVGRRATPWPS